jgi:hypothetical protein
VQVFSRLKAMVGGGRPKSQLDQVPRAELQDKPITLGLLIHAATAMDKTNKSLDEWVGKKRQHAVDLPTLDDKVQSGVGVVSFSIVSAAMKQAGVNLISGMPGEPIPKEVLISLAFGYFVVMGMANPLKSEGFEINTRDKCLGLISNLLLLRTDQEKLAAAQEVATMVQGIVAAAEEHKNVEEWIDNTAKLVLFYLAQVTTTEPKLKELKALDMLGAQLKSALAIAS